MFCFSHHITYYYIILLSHLFLFHFFPSQTCMHFHKSEKNNLFLIIYYFKLYSNWWIFSINLQLLEESSSNHLGNPWLVGNPRKCIWCYRYYCSRVQSWPELATSTFQHKNWWARSTLQRRHSFLPQLHGEQQVPLHYQPSQGQVCGLTQLQQGRRSTSPALQDGQWRKNEA